MRQALFYCGCLRKVLVYVCLDAQFANLVRLDENTLYLVIIMIVVIQDIVLKR
jgi:hypothetical protein